jgi:hypothetical protein
MVASDDAPRVLAGEIAQDPCAWNWPEGQAAITA